jgi:hypothetical protein
MRPLPRSRLASNSDKVIPRAPTTTPWLTIGLSCAVVTVIALCCVVGLGGLFLFNLRSSLGSRSYTIRPTRAVGSATVPTPIAPPAQPSPNMTPAASTPIPACGQPTLILGSTQYRIEVITPAADNSLTVPPDSPEVAYWLEGTNANRVFGLSPTPNNLAWSTSLKAGDETTFIGEDCTPETYVVKAVETGPLNNPALFDQATAGLTLLLQTGPGEGLIIQGSPAEVLVIVTDTPPPSGTVLREAEISFLEKTVSPDGQSLQVGISIFNYGAAPLTVSAGDVSLSPDNAALLNAEPALPREIGPGITETFYFTFPLSGSDEAILKIFDAEFDLADF